MGCACPLHEGSNATLAWQAAGAIAQNQKHAEFYGFISSGSESLIVPFAPGAMPRCVNGAAWTTRKHGMAGNPDCVALEFMAAQVAGDYQNTSAVIISDGQPAGPAPMRDSHLVSHTRQMANALKRHGVRFLSVLVNSYDESLYPAEVSVKVNQLKDLRNMETAFGWLSGTN